MFKHKQIGKRQIFLELMYILFVQIVLVYFQSHVLNTFTFQVNKDQTKIRRTTPIGKPKDYDACTLYVEKLPSYADHKWIKDVFEHFGVVDHINIPRFKISKKVKGFAFVEFSSPESVIKACEVSIFFLRCFYYFGYNFQTNCI